tara:strand:+ start:805 stop:1455 length:651 start_codon:yes stop_codon:yes gene_type:complete
MTEVESENEMTFSQKYENIVAEVESMSKTMKTLFVSLKSLQKEINKKGKSPRKKVVNDDPNVEKKPSALQKPVQISDELCKFLEFPVGECYSRQQVTTSINAYVKKHDLQNPENKRFILLDQTDEGKKLAVLLRNPDQPLTFFNIQRYLKPHYPLSIKEQKEAKAKETLNSQPGTSSVVPDSAEVSDETPPSSCRVSDGSCDKKKSAPRRVVRTKA